MPLTPEQRRHLIYVLDNTTVGRTLISPEELGEIRRILRGEANAIAIDTGDYDLEIYPFANEQSGEALAESFMAVSMGYVEGESKVTPREALEFGDTPYDYDGRTVMTGVQIWRDLEALSDEGK